MLALVTQVTPPPPQALMQRAVCRVRALVVLPTKELAQQVCGPRARGQTQSPGSR